MNAGRPAGQWTELPHPVIVTTVEKTLGVVRRVRVDLAGEGFETLAAGHFIEVSAGRILRGARTPLDGGRRCQRAAAVESSGIRGVSEVAIFPVRGLSGRRWTTGAAREL